METPQWMRRNARWVVPAVALLLPLSLTAQQPAGGPSAWAEEVLKKEGYVTPPPELADAVTIPRYLNLALSNPSPDRKWFLDEIGDGPVVMKTFSRPFHELGGVFIDFRANRARTLTVRNSVGIQIISAADGTKKAVQIPPVGPQGQMNNNYVNDLRNDLSATIDELDRRQIVDRQRLAIGGHSYGAFSTVNAMVHTPFFKAGIAGDGAYNRTLTPIGFQTERRDLWEARGVYLSMSPFLYANNLTGALLMYHNMADQNVGTDPTNSIRLYHALSGLGKTAALYMYPYEDHGPVAKETLLDMWARWAAWLDKYCKHPQKPEMSDKKTTTEPVTPGR